MDLTALGLYCQDLGPILVQYIPRAWLMSYTYNLATFYIRAELILTNFIFSTLIFLFLANFVDTVFIFNDSLQWMTYKIWDGPGLQSLRENRKVQCAIIVYDISRKDSLRIAREWLDILRREFSPDIFKALAGNKADLVSEREVTYEVICFSKGLRRA